MEVGRTALEEPRLEDRDAFLVAGIEESYFQEAGNVIPRQWERLLESLGRIPGQIDNVAYGVAHNFRDNGHWDYVTGVEVEDPSPVLPGFIHFRVPAQRYLVFHHSGHVVTLNDTWHAIVDGWLPASRYRITRGPYLERFGEEFDAITGLGGLEFWIPVEET